MKRDITETQKNYLKGLMSLWWEIPHKLVQYNKSAKRVNKILHSGTYELGGDDEQAIKDLMECVNKII